MVAECVRLTFELSGDQRPKEKHDGKHNWWRAVWTPLERGVGRAARTALVVSLRLTLLGPLRLLRGLLYALSGAFEALADGIGDAQIAIGPICELPLHREARRALQDAVEHNRIELIRSLRDSTE